MLSSRRRVLDAFGGALAVVLATWAMVSAIGKSDARPFAFVAGVLVGVGAFCAGRALMRWRAAAPCLAVALVALLGAIVGRGHVTEAGGLPLRYANANAALFALGALAIAAAVAGAITIASRPVVMVTALIFVGLTVATRSVAGVLTLAVGALIALAGRWLAGPLAVAVVVLIMGVTSAFAVATPHEGHDDVAVRTQLWHEAVRLMHTEPVRGIGPGRFSVLNTVSRDADLRWAHNDYLQVGAELGAIGLVLVVLLLFWAALELLLAARLHQPLAPWAAGALAASAVHAGVDYVFHFAVVIALTALMVGAGTSHHHRTPETRGSLHPHP